MPRGNCEGVSVGEFTSWGDLYRQLLNDLASGAFRTRKSYSVGGRTMEYRSFDEFQKLFALVKEQAEQEAAAASGETAFAGRTCGGLA